MPAEQLGKFLLDVIHPPKVGDVLELELDEQIHIAPRTKIQLVRIGERKTRETLVLARRRFNRQPSPPAWSGRGPDTSSYGDGSIAILLLHILQKHLHRGDV